MSEKRLSQLERDMIDAHTAKARRQVEEQRRNNPPKPQNAWTREEAERAVEFQGATWLHAFLLPSDWDPTQGIDALLRHPDMPDAARERHRAMRRVADAVQRRRK